MKLVCYLVRYDTGILGVILRNSAEDCASLLGLDLCFEPDCGDSRPDQPHAHIPDKVFEPPQFYPSSDMEYAGLRFRSGRLPKIGMIRWELYSDNDPRRVIHFESSSQLI